MLPGPVQVNIAYHAVVGTKATSPSWLMPMVLPSWYVICQPINGPIGANAGVADTRGVGVAAPRDGPTGALLHEASPTTRIRNSAVWTKISLKALWPRCPQRTLVR